MTATNAGQGAGQGILLGIDVGATKLEVALGRASGELLRETRCEKWTSGDPTRDVARIAETAREVLSQAGVALREVAAIGVSAPGPLDPSTGVVRDAPNLPGWHEVRISDQLARAFGRRVRLENDANAAALAEWRFGAGRGSRDFAFLTMSTGVGAGLILDGRLYRGARFGAGEVGHMPVVPHGRLCACGLRGCLEAYTGGAALAARIRADAAAGAHTSIVERAGGDPSRASAEHWVAALRDGEPYARALAEEFVDLLAQGLAILILSLDVDRIALGTIVARNTDLFLAPLRAAVAERVWPRLRETQIVAAELGARLAAYAGLCAALLELESAVPSSA
ncbi:MAG: ROK family protein [Myxococcota bacterium]